MAVRIRLSRMGRKNHPFYRIGAFDALKRRDGDALENLGHYDPFEEDLEKRIVVKADRVKFWIARGAKPSVNVAALLKQKGVQ
ncbi:MAG: 30S ribosomal protein S16 [Planctomycetota bacterium]